LPYTEDTLGAMDDMIISKMRFFQYKIPHGEYSKYFVHSTTPWGLGATLLDVLRAFIIGYLYDRTVILDHRKLVYDFPYEPTTSLRTSALNEILAPSTKKTYFNFRLQQQGTVHWKEDPNFLGQMQTALSGMPVLQLCPSLGHLSHHRLYYHGLIMHSFLKLKEEYRAPIREFQNTLGRDTPRLGVHIRQADALTDPSSKFRRFAGSSYLHAVEQVADATGIREVFISTDSDRVLRQLPKDSGINFVYDDKEKRYEDCIAHTLRANPELKKQETLTTLKNIYLLAECDYLIGSQSALTALALALSYYRKKSVNAIFLLNADEQFFHKNDKVYAGTNRELNGVLLENPADARLACLVLRLE